VGYRDRNGRGRAGPPGNFLASEDLVGCGGFPGRNPRGFEFGSPRGFGGRICRGLEGQIPENVIDRGPRGSSRGRTPVNFVGRVPRDFEGEEFSPKDRDLDKTMMLRDHNGGKKCPRCGYEITDRPSWSFDKVWYVCLPWY
jgi:hypothetical protein